MTVKTLTYAALAERLKFSFEAARSLVTGEVTTLKVRIESLQAELIKLEATAASHRADYERERDRADRLVIELLKATANTTREMAAKLEGEIAALRLAAGPAADVMAARGALDRVTIGVGEVHSVSADRRSREPRGQRQDVILSVAQEGVGGGHEVANPLVRWPPAW